MKLESITKRLINQRKTIQDLNSMFDVYLTLTE